MNYKNVPDVVNEWLQKKPSILTKETVDVLPERCFSLQYVAFFANPDGERYVYRKDFPWFKCEESIFEALEYYRLRATAEAENLLENYMEKESNEH